MSPRGLGDLVLELEHSEQVFDPRLRDGLATVGVELDETVTLDVARRLLDDR